MTNIHPWAAALLRTKCYTVDIFPGRSGQRDDDQCLDQFCPVMLIYQDQQRWLYPSENSESIPQYSTGDPSPPGSNIDWQPMQQGELR